MEEHQRCASVAHETDVQVSGAPHDVRHVRFELYLVPDGVDNRAQKVKQRPLNPPSVSESVDGIQAHSRPPWGVINERVKTVCFAHEA